ncbi:MAG: hypothetical protein SGCHY_004612 [Lobulomycetales sp.]
MPEMEMQWAVKAFEHAETFFSQLEKLAGSQTQASQTAIQRFRFTTPALDEEIYAHFRREFPDMPVAGFDEHLHFKSPERKKQWREFINVYEKSVEDYNFGSLLRVDPFQDYSEENSIFVTRLQFIAIELARCREGVQFGLKKTEE